ncbi:MAG: lycopene cyclase domain-containing protein [Pedobacter sp.]|nr:MAG: lycopene cyclase domain-containing protein [Pedobacter sp.]
MSTTFLYINIFLLIIPFALSLDRKALQLKDLKYYLFPSLIVTVIFSETGVFLAGSEVWTFNPEYVGLMYRKLPVGMYFFYFAFSFAALGIYDYLNNRFPKNDLQKYSLTVSNVLLGLMIAMMFFAYSKWYTVVTFAILFLLILNVEYRSQFRFMYRFYRAFLVVLIPFYICFGILCNLPIIMYNAKETVNGNLFNIPFENHFYMMGMLLLGVFVLEVFKQRRLK